MGERLSKFERREVLGSRIKIMRPGEGLSEILDIEPVALRHGEKVYVVLTGEVVDVEFPPVKRGSVEHLLRKHTVATEEVFLVSAGDVAALLDRERDRVRKVREEALGIQRLPEPDDPVGIYPDRPTDEELHEAHLRGEHADDRVPDCVDCAEEIRAEQQEAAEA